MKFHFSAAETEQANAALAVLTRLYGQSRADEADVLVPLGGDGFMLETLHGAIDDPRPTYGMNLGTVGFLMNVYRDQGLAERVSRARRTPLHLLRMRALLADGSAEEGLAINDAA